MGVLCVYFLVPRSWSLITSWDVNGPGFLGKMADFRTESGNIYDEPGASYSARK